MSYLTLGEAGQTYEEYVANHTVDNDPLGLLQPAVGPADPAQAQPIVDLVQDPSVMDPGAPVVAPIAAPNWMDNPLAQAVAAGVVGYVGAAFLTGNGGIRLTAAGAMGYLASKNGWNVLKPFRG